MVGKKFDAEKRDLKEVFEDADFDTLVNNLGSNPDICQPEEIDISKPGWEVILNFSSMEELEKQKNMGGDFWKLEGGEAFGDFLIRIERVPNVKVILSYN
ncbi:hypothetical protein IT411_01635 [Candidatus Peregrinibacteria bacterium]|nr:hypothetical protein [Candidatus Peregrinibacteria bacterium]